MSYSSIWFIDRTLSGATTPTQSGPGSDGNEGVLRILQSSYIIGASPSDCLVSYQGPGNNGNEGGLCILQSTHNGDSRSDCLVSYPGPGNDGNEGGLCILQSTHNGDSRSDCLCVIYRTWEWWQWRRTLYSPKHPQWRLTIRLFTGHSLGETHPSAEIQSVYSIHHQPTGLTQSL